MSPIFRMLLAVLLGGMAVWFIRSRPHRGEPAQWFFALLVAAALSGVLSAVSWWIPDETISRSFWIAYWISLSLTVFLVFCFTRSFGSKADFTLLFWSIPIMLDLAIIIIDNAFLFERSGNTWAATADNAFVYLHIAIIVFYAGMSIYYCFMVYRALKSHDQKEESARFRYILAGLLVIFVSQLIAGPFRSLFKPGNPINEIGTLIGTLLLLLGIVEPKLAFLERKRQGVA